MPHWDTSDKGAGCYVHLPFCDRICPYCDFAVVEFKAERVLRYLNALHAELERADIPPGGVQTIYLGGGTPSALSAEQINTLLAALFQRFGLAPGSIECTLEANPSRNSVDLSAYREAGITRLSVGVQSFEDQELHRLGRTHSAAEAERYIKEARRAGHDNIGLDLIAGVPGQSADNFRRTLRRALSCEPGHVSVYALTIEQGTPYATWFQKDSKAFPDDDAMAEQLENAHDLLTAAGLEHYELSNFAKPGFECAHNIGYWRQRDCLALGMSACGYRDGARTRNARSYEAYCAAIEAGQSATEDTETLAWPERVGEAAMLALRTAEGIVDQDFRDRFGVDPPLIFAAARKKCCEAGLLEVDGSGARLTPRGRLLANSVCTEFLHPFFPAPAGL
ncbi:MAG TPA: radical SAM family heme chaperone HemW [Candidatus Tumulicola sp.]|nr:radical SAM family heme chaperone HemW [Candidatus Tumulicola sp.]